MQDSQRGLTRAEQRGRIPSLALLATLLGIQPRIRLTFWAVTTLPGHDELLINQHPQVFLLRAALNPFSAQPVFALGIALTYVQDLELGQIPQRRQKQLFEMPDSPKCQCLCFRSQAQRLQSQFSQCNPK